MYKIHEYHDKYGRILHTSKLNFLIRIVLPSFPSFLPSPFFPSGLLLSSYLCASFLSFPFLLNTKPYKIIFPSSFLLVQYIIPSKKEKKSDLKTSLSRFFNEFLFFILAPFLFPFLFIFSYIICSIPQRITTTFFLIVSSSLPIFSSRLLDLTS